MSAPNSGPDPRKLPQAGRRLRSFMGLGLQGFRGLGFRDSGLPGLFFGCGGWGARFRAYGLEFTPSNLGQPRGFQQGSWQERIRPYVKVDTT